jgi:hypothetical protein
LLLRSVAAPDDLGPDPDPTFEKKTDPDVTPKRKQIRILLYVKFGINFLQQEYFDKNMAYKTYV